MKIEEAISKAIEGGWKLPYGMYQENLALEVSPALVVSWHSNADHTVASTPLEVILLDPSFWQSLGKAMGWEKRTEENGYDKYVFYKWREEWHCFIDHLAEGKSIEDYFKTL